MGEKLEELREKEEKREKRKSWTMTDVSEYLFLSEHLSVCSHHPVVHQTKHFVQRLRMNLGKHWRHHLGLFNYYSVPAVGYE